MIPILYEASETLFASNGLGRLRDCISCRSTEGRNEVFELDFEYPVTGAHFDEITEGRIIYATHDETGIPQPFDIVGSTKPLSGVVTFHAVHISYRQLYLTATGSNINSLADALALFSTATPSNPFSYDADFTSTAYMSAADGTPRSVRQMLGGIEGSVLDAYGGELEFDRFAVHLRSARGVRRDFTIRYGVNLLDYNEETDFTGVYTSCIPFWRGQNDSGQEVTVVGSQVSVGAASYCGRDLCVPLDLSEKFEDMPTRAQVEAMALTVMQSRQVNLPARNIRVDFVRLQDMPEFSQFESLLECNLCDTVGVVFPRYNMSGEFKIVKTVFNVLKDRYEEMELGALSTSLSEALGITETPNNDRVNENFYVDADGNVTTNGSITASGTIDGANIQKNGKNYIGYQTFNFTVNFSAGTIGSRGYQGSADASLDGYTPIGVSVISVGASGSYIPVAFLSGTTVYFNAYRATTSAVSGSAVTARVIYRKD